MTTDAAFDNAKPDRLAQIPRMISKTDIGLIRNLLSDLPNVARIVEFGPWLGGVSAHLAEFGELHVVDRFIWTENNAKRVPGVAKSGKTFRPVFDEILKKHNINATVHEAEFDEFVWDYGAIDFCFIDAPRTAKDLIVCLHSISKFLSDDSILTIKNGLNQSHFDMLSLIEVLLSKSIFELVETHQPAWCNIAVLKKGAKFERIHELQYKDGFFDKIPLDSSVKDPWGGPIFPIARLAQHIQRGDFSAVYDQLDRLIPDMANIHAWDAQELFLDIPEEDAAQMAVFAEAMSVHNDPGLAQDNRIPFEESPALALRSYWRRNSHKPWRSRVITPAKIAWAFRQGNLHWPGKLESHVRGRSMMEIGPRLGASGIGYMVAGARSYIGIDTQPTRRGAVTAARLASSSLPDWLAQWIVSAPPELGIVLQGDPVEAINMCLLQESDETTRDLADSISATLSVQAPGIDIFWIPQSRDEAIRPWPMAQGLPNGEPDPAGAD